MPFFTHCLQEGLEGDSDAEDAEGESVSLRVSVIKGH